MEVSLINVPAYVNIFAIVSVVGLLALIVPDLTLILEGYRSIAIDVAEQETHRHLT
jgi:type II secretory pathway component PulF